MSEQDEGPVVCYWCRREVAPDSYLCPNCGRQPRPEGITPLGGEPAGEPPRPGEARGPSPIRDPRAEYERRRAERLAAQAQRGEMGYGAYLRWLVREDQVFGALLAMLVVQIAVSAAGVALSPRENEWWPIALVSPLFQLIMLLGILTLQRWAHTVVVWLAALNLLLSGVGLVRLVLAPLAMDSALQVLFLWFRWLFGIASTLFILVVLSERSSYFEGPNSRVAPKRTRLKQFLRRDYWERALARADGRPREEADTPQRPRERLRFAPSQFERGAPAEGRGPEATQSMLTIDSEQPVGRAPDDAPEAGLRPFGGGEALPPAPSAPAGGWPDEGVGRHQAAPVEPAPGQVGSELDAMRRALSVSHLRRLAGEDRVFAALLVALALQIIVVLTGNLWAICGAAGLTWAVLALRPWAFWLALALAAMQALTHAILLAAALMAGAAAWGGLAYYAAMALVNAFIVWALLARRGYFL